LLALHEKTPFASIATHRPDALGLMLTTAHCPCVAGAGRCMTAETETATKLYFPKLLDFERSGAA
jgi:hypothetical protein